MFLSQNSGISIWIPSTDHQLTVKSPIFQQTLVYFSCRNPPLFHQPTPWPCRGHAVRAAPCGGCRGTRSSTLRSAARKTSRQPGAPEDSPQAIRPCSSALDINCCRFLVNNGWFSQQLGIGSWKNGDHLRYLDISGITIYKYLEESIDIDIYIYQYNVL